jgi:hypothetical protein
MKDYTKFRRLFFWGWILTFLFSTYSNASGQWGRVYTGDFTASAYSVDQTTDGGFVIAAEKSISGEGRKLWVLRVNENGDVIWQKEYGEAGELRPWSIKATPDGGSIVAVYTELYSDFWILKLRSDGSIEWQKTYGRSVYDLAYSIDSTAEGGYVIAGSTIASGGAVWVLKLTSSGSIEWQNFYDAGTSAEVAYCIRQTDDSGYIVGGSTRSVGAGDEDYWLLKLTSDGSIQWQKTFGGTGSDRLWHASQVPDGGYILLGKTQSFGAGEDDFWVLKLDSEGKVVWQKTYGGIRHDSPITDKSMTQAEDGGFAFTGITYSFGDTARGLFVKLDGEGNIQWQKTYGGSVVGSTYALKQTQSQDYVLAGYGNHVGEKSGVFVVRVGNDADIPNCCLISDVAVSVTNTNATVTTTVASPQSSSASPVDTAITWSESNAISDGVCAPKGDINGDCVVDLVDLQAAVILVKISGPDIRWDYSRSGADVNGDGRVGLEEAIYILQKLSNMR